MKNKLHFDFRKLCFVLALILTQCLYAQNKTITGTVTDSTVCNVENKASKYI